MAAKELSDYFTGTVTPDNNVTLAVDVRGVIPERLSGNIVVHRGDDKSQVRVKLGGDEPVVFVVLPWTAMSEADAGTVLDYWADPAKGAMGHKSIKWTHHDGHDYTVVFSREFERRRELGGYLSIPGVLMEVLGNAP